MYEWSYLLSTLSSKGLLGAIQRCLWGSLGKGNFLHKTPSWYKSHAFWDLEVPSPKPMSVGIAYTEEGKKAALQTLWVQER